MEDALKQISRWRKAVIGVSLALFFFVLLELVMRIAFPLVRTATLPPNIINAQLNGTQFQYDPDLYWYWQQLPDPGIKLNEFGFRRIKPMTARKQHGVTRAITFGDSQTFGAGVEADKTFTAFAEEDLGPGWEVLNGGISGYKSLNVYRLLQLKILRYEPDIVVINLVPYDSERDNGPLAGHATASPHRTPTQLIKQIMWKSAFYRGLQHLVQLGRPAPKPFHNPSSGREPAPTMPLGNHDLIAEWGRENGVQVVFTEYPVWSRDHGLSCVTQLEDLPRGHSVVPAYQRLKASGLPVEVLFQDTNHLTVEGNRIVGQALADTLRPLKR